MKHTNFRRGLAGLLAALTLVQGCALTALAAEVETTQVTEQAVAQADIQLKDGETVVIPAGANEATVKQALFDALVVNPEGIDPQSLEWEYEREGWTKKVGVTVWGNEMFGPLHSFTEDYKEVFNYTYTYPALTEAANGDYQIRLANDPETVVTLTKAAKLSSSITLNQGCSVALPYNKDTSVNYDALRENIFAAAVASTTPELTVDDVNIEYYAEAKSGSLGSLGKAWMPLEGGKNAGLTYPGMTVGENQKIRISYAENNSYYGVSKETTVNVIDNRIQSNVVLKEGASFTYNMDADVMEQAILDNVIDWDASTLPDKGTLTADNFVIEYYAEAVLFDGGIDSGINEWVPIEGKSYDTGNINWATYPQMGAGENQQIRISFKGDANYKPCDEVEGTVTVNKAKVSVKVNSTNVYTDEDLPADFITTDPADEFDIYTIYAGVTSNVTTALYLDLPERYADSAFLDLIDGALELAGQKTLTQMMQEGVTVGELRELFSTQALLDLLDTLNIDTGTFGKILETINNLPGIADSVRVAFGEPTNRAGLYTVAAVTDNQNYETGVGIGFLLVKMHLSGSQLTWNKEIPNGKLTAEQAKTFDFKATLSYNGDMTVDQSSVHYLYSGFTSKWRVYSSTTTPPTEPGSYVVTVCILGGNYMAAPITRSFTITK